MLTYRQFGGSALLLLLITSAISHVSGSGAAKGGNASGAVAGFVKQQILVSVRYFSFPRGISHVRGVNGNSLKSFNATQAENQQATSKARMPLLIFRMSCSNHWIRSRNLPASRRHRTKAPPEPLPSLWILVLFAVLFLASVHFVFPPVAVPLNKIFITSHVDWIRKLGSHRLLTFYLIAKPQDEVSLTITTGHCWGC